MTKTIFLAIAEKLGDVKVVGSTAYAIKSIYDVFGSLYDLNVILKENGKSIERGETGVGYRKGQAQNTKGKYNAHASVNGGVTLLGNAYTSAGAKYNNEFMGTLMHETMHALGFLKHQKYGSRFLTVLNEWVSGGPFLRLDDFYQLSKSHLGPQWSIRQNANASGRYTYTWDLNGNAYCNGAFIRNFGMPYIYDIVAYNVGHITLDFSNFATMLKVDLRPSELSKTQPGHIDNQKIHGTFLGSVSFGSWNLYNAPDALLDDAKGGTGNDLIVGNDRDNMLDGGLGDDTLIGLKGCDQLRGGGGIDTVDYSQDADNGGDKGIVVNLAKQRRITSSGTIRAQYGRDGFGDVDQLIDIENAIGTRKDDLLLAAEGGSVLQGLGGNDALWGFDGNDSLEGGDGDDWLYGLGGNDTLVGGDGADTLVGQNGNDILTGGSGADLFCFHLRYGKDTVTDFKSSEGDTLQIDTRLAKDWAEVHKAIRLQDGNLILNFGRDTLTLQGVNSLSVGDVHFVSG